MLNNQEHKGAFAQGNDSGVPLTINARIYIHHGDTEFTEKSAKNVLSVCSVSPWFHSRLSRDSPHEPY